MRHSKMASVTYSMFKLDGVLTLLSWHSHNKPSRKQNGMVRSLCSCLRSKLFDTNKIRSYVGSFGHDYEMLSGVDMYEQSMYQATGSGNSMMANRISWFYDLRGPSFVIDTACSSSMLALHEACRELYSGNSTMVSSQAHLYEGQVLTLELGNCGWGKLNSAAGSMAPLDGTEIS